MPTRDDILRGTTQTIQRAPGILVPTLPNPKITTLDISKGPPPANSGDIWIAANVDTNGTRWHFQYNANSSSAYKWEFIGGAFMQNQIDTSEGTASGSFVDLATVGPTLNWPRSGDYTCFFGATISNSVINDGAIIGLINNGSELSSSVRLSYIAAAAGAAGQLSLIRTASALGMTSGQTVKLQYAAVTGGTATFFGRYLRILPVRVS